METLQATDFASLHEILSQFRKSKRWVFRGHADIQWKLLPRCGRAKYTSVDDWQVFEAWKRRAIEHVRNPLNSDWDWLAVAQHHGLATRLLDWSHNPLNAAFFAVRQPCDSAAAIYAADIKNRIKTHQDHPKEYRKTALFYPSGVVPRIVRQGGVFTIHRSPSSPLAVDEDVRDLVRIEVPRKHCDKLLRELSFYGINASTLFPDLDGLSDFLNWTVESKEYWAVPEDLTEKYDVPWD
jgi:hypothetical protein